jgi:hypothetical protein
MAPSISAFGTAVTRFVSAISRSMGVSPGTLIFIAS